jgi:hypothetical protein
MWLRQKRKDLREALRQALADESRYGREALVESIVSQIADSEKFIQRQIDEVRRQLVLEKQKVRNSWASLLSHLRDG